jgi:hypothetical protein
MQAADLVALHMEREMSKSPLARYAKTLRTLSSVDVARISSMIRQGYGSRGIKAETPFTSKQINAVFALVSMQQQ